MTSTFVFLLCLFLLGKGGPVYLKVGEVCPEGQIILTEKECTKALEDLNLPQPTVKYSVTYEAIPRGCSYRPAEFGARGGDEGHFNKATSGVGRFDLRPVCKMAMRISAVSEINHASCGKNKDRCHSDAVCDFIPSTSFIQCQCKKGFEGNGKECKASADVLQAVVQPDVKHPADEWLYRTKYLRIPKEEVFDETQVGQVEKFWPVYLKVGEVCPEDQVILTEQECIKALEDLNLPQPTVKHSVTYEAIPRGCSYRPAEFGARGGDEGHFNKATRGVGRWDLRPVCKASIQYSCTNKGCGWTNYVQGTHWGYYSRTHVDCQTCKNLCSADSNCGAYECTSTYCSWWKKGMCKESDSNIAYNTCRAIDGIKYRLDNNPGEKFWNLGEVELYKNGKKITIDPSTCNPSSEDHTRWPCKNVLDGNTENFWIPNYQIDTTGYYWFEFFAGDADEIRIFQNGNTQKKVILTRTIYSHGVITKTDSQVLELNNGRSVWEIHSIGLLTSIQYSCTDRACEWSNYVEGTDWGYYSKSLGDCQTCKNLCSADSNCGAVECGKDYCTWWKNGVCTESDSNSQYNTCRAITVCEPQFNMNKHVCSSKYEDNFFGQIVNGNKGAVTVMNIIGTLLSMAKFTVCFGNLDTEEFNEKKGDPPMEDHGCETMIPTNGRFSSVSFQDPIMNFGVCSLISSCASIPTVAFGLNDQVLDFIFGKIAMMATAVPSPLFEEILRKVESSVAMGISPTGDFIYEVSYWRGERTMHTIDFRGHFFFSMSNKISLWTLISPPPFIKKFTDKLEKYTAKLTPYTDRAGKYLPKKINDKIDVEGSILSAFQNKLDNLLMLKATTLMMLDLSAIEEGVGEAIDCVTLGICETSASQMMQKVIYGTNFLLQASGSLVLDLKQILPTLPELEINLESAQFLKYGYGIYVQVGIDQTELVEGMFGPMCEMFNIPVPRVALQMQAYVNDYGIGLQADATWFKLNCKFTWKEKSLDCDINADTFKAFIEMIGDAIEMLGNAAHQIVTKAGDVIAAGALSVAKIGDKVFNGLVLGVGLFKGRVKSLWDNIIADLTKWWSLDDFCDCNMRGQLQIMSQDMNNNNEIRYLDAHTGMNQRVTWSTNVHKVKWRCKDDDNWKTHTMDHSGRIWSIQYRYEDKSPCPNFDGKWYNGGVSNTRRTGRVTFITTEEVGFDTSESVEAFVGDISPEEKAELNKECDKCPQCQEVYKAFHDCQSTAVGRDGECFHRDGTIARKCSLRVCEDQYIENTKCHHTYCDPDKPPEAEACLDLYHEWSYCVIDADIQTCQDDLTKEEEDQCIEEACKETKTLFQECMDKAHEASVAQGNEFVQMTSNSLILPFGVLLSGIALVYILQRRNDKIEETMPLIEEEL